MVFSNVFSILFVACMVSVRQERGTEFGRETAREGEERRGLFQGRHYFLLPANWLCMQN